MPIVEWNETFSIAIEEIDRHHRHLVDLLNKLYDEFADGTDTGELGGVLDELVDYATYHFSCEESRMSEAGYPELPGHQAEHERFIRRVNEIQKDFLNQEARVYLETLAFIKNWLTNHILGSDARFGHYAAVREAVTGVNLRLN